MREIHQVKTEINSQNKEKTKIICGEIMKVFKNESSDLKNTIENEIGKAQLQMKKNIDNSQELH